MTPRQTSFMAAAAALALAATAFGAYRLGAAGAPHGAPAHSDAPAAAGERRVLYWHDPMVPGQRFDKPGPSPFMDMPLQPVYADAGSDEGSIGVSARQTQSLGLRTVAVRLGTLAPRLAASGTVDWNERGLAVIQARNAGFVEKLFVRATLDRVARDQPLAELYVPDWVAAQEEFLAVRSMTGADTAALLDAARARMRQAGMPATLIAEVERGGQVQARVTIRAPQAGSLIEIGVREGMTVAPGSTLFRLNTLDSVWVNAAIPESQAALLRPGMAVQATAAGFADTPFTGRVEAVLPQVDADTRTLRVRVVLANPGQRLAPGMFVSLALAGATRESLLVPAEALIRTGTRSVVMLAEGEGRFRPVDVEAGRETQGFVEIRHGLAAGQQVVVSGQFLLDSEASLRAAGTRLAEPAAAPPAYETTAVFEEIVDGLAMLSHPPIAELKWGAMTMGFKPPAQGWPRDIAPGARVRVRFALAANGEPQLLQITQEGGQ